METAQQAEPTSVPAGRATLTGELVAREIDSSTKSVDAYLGEELVLVDGDQRWVLAPTDAVPRERLIALDGQRVVVVATLQAAPPPNPLEAHPIGPDGGPLPRADRWVVQQVEVAR